MNNRELKISRLISAPRELVFAAFSDTKNISNWWGPNGFRTTTHSANFKVGGEWIYTMHGPDGTDYPNRIRYTLINPPERLEYDHDAGEGDPNGFKAYVSFEERGQKTFVTLCLLLASDEFWEEMVKFGAVQGGEQNLERLDKFLQERL